MSQQVKLQSHPSSSLEDDCLLQSECKICYLQYDSHLHYPMLVCSSQHTLCLACFRRLSRGQQFIHCPFCKRGSETESVVRFRFALSASGKYRALREKYLTTMDLLKAKGGIQDEQEYKGTLMDLEGRVRNLSERLKSSEDSNRSLLLKMEVEEERYRTFEQEIIECKHNDILIKNRLTMAQYDLRTAEREKTALSEKLTDAKREVSNLSLNLVNSKMQNQALRQEVARLTKEQQSVGMGMGGMVMGVQLQANSDKKVEKSEDSPEMQQQYDSPSQQLFLTKKKSKSQHRLKTELPPSSVNHTHHTPVTTKRVSTSRKAQTRSSKERDECNKFANRKIQKVMKF